ncbi:MAG: DNA-directed RNA polymerase [Thaumarchaeota archaeon]|nr:DNA-directed RNA polymerase [Candidatus Calditenuaceae archaeon]MDW8043110.1 DNA-directed RNA polymerase [Nitrososphaerota archaeon]
MFYLVTIEDVIGIEPREFGGPLKEIAMEKLISMYEGVVDEELGYVITVTDVEVDEVGFLLPRDPASYHKVRCTLLTYMPMLQEVVEGEVVDVTEFGAFVRVVTIDALLHLSQIMDDYVSLDKKNMTLVGSKTGLKLGVGDKVRARVVAVSISGGKVGLTTRQPYLGNLEWIAQQVAPKPAAKR